jgi:ribosomal protein L11 methyltransferase
MHLRDQDTAPPCDTLHIYYIKGRLSDIGDVSGIGFIGNWEEEDTSFLFFSEPAPDRIDNLLERQPHLVLVDRFRMSYDDWHGEPIRPMRVGRFVIMPPWHTTDVASSELPIILDPGVVFGVGNHPTTRDCLACLELLFDRHPIASTLDLGTGTGVLAIAAARLGSPKNLAVDTNFLAAGTARRNARINGLDDHVFVACGSAFDFVYYPSDLIMANIHFDVMKVLIGDPGFFKHKWFVLSGLLKSEADKIETLLAGSPATITDRLVRDGIWNTFYGHTDQHCNCPEK